MPDTGHEETHLPWAVRIPILLFGVWICFYLWVGGVLITVLLWALAKWIFKKKPRK